LRDGRRNSEFGERKRELSDRAQKRSVKGIRIWSKKGREERKTVYEKDEAKTVKRAIIESDMGKGRKRPHNGGEGSKTIVGGRK